MGPGNALWHSQNFLRRAATAREIVRLANLTDQEVVVEIGPGLGMLTRELARACARVIAVEYDRALYEELRHSLGGLGNVELIQADFRQYDLPDREYRVVANLPFAITSEIMAKLTTGGRAPTEAYLVMQAEAARRFAGPPYDHESLRSLLLKPRFELKIVRALRRTEFRPVPNADSVLLRMRKRGRPLLTGREERAYRDLLCFAFSQQGEDIAARLGRLLTRPQLTRLAHDHGFSRSARVVDLSCEQWVAILRRVPEEKQGLLRGAERRLSRRQRGLSKIHRSRACPGWQYGAEGGG